MKKIFLFIVLIISFSACKNSAARIAEKLKNSPSIAVPGFGKVTSYSSEGSDIILETDASARYLNYDVTNNDTSGKQLIGDNVVTAIFSLGIGDDVLDSNTGVIFRFQWSDGRCVDIRFSPSEIQARAESIRKRFNR